MSPGPKTRDRYTRQWPGPLDSDQKSKRDAESWKKVKTNSKTANPEENSRSNVKNQHMDATENPRKGVDRGIVLLYG